MTNKISVALCDDEPIALDMISAAITSCFSRYGYELLLEKYGNSVVFSKIICEKKYDLVFLDIDMPGINGIDLGVKLKDINDRTAIIFVSNYEGRVFDAFKAQPFGFVRKSTFLKDVESIVKLYAEYANKSAERDFIEYKTHMGTQKIYVDEILYVECEGDVQNFYIKNCTQPVKVRLRMKDLAQTLRDKGILRCHHGYLVNYRYVKRINADTVVLTNGASVLISRNRKKEFMEEYMKLCRNGGHWLSKN